MDSMNKLSWDQELYVDYHRPIVFNLPHKTNIRKYKSSNTLDALNIEEIIFENRKKPKDAFLVRYENIENENEEDVADIESTKYYVYKNGIQCFIEEEFLPTSQDGEVDCISGLNSKNLVYLITEYCKHNINAFLNTNGGKVYFGVTRQGKIVGIPLSRKLRDMIRLRIDSITSSYQPQVDPQLVNVTFHPVINNVDIYNDNFNQIDHVKHVVIVDVSSGNAPLYRASHGNAYIRRGGKIYRMEKSLIRMREERGRPLFEGKLPDIPSDFIGRSKEIEEILNFIDLNQKFAIIHISGAPMVGKSTLAHKLVNTLKKKYTKQFVINLKGINEKYINVTEAQTIVIRSTFRLLHLPPDKKGVYKLYDSCFTNKDCILLVENLGNENQLSDLLPQSAKSLVVIATSRRSFKIDNPNAFHMKLTSLSVSNSIQLLKNIVGHNIDDEIAKKIVLYCGCMPLTIKIVASKIRNKPINLDNFSDHTYDEDVLEYAYNAFDSFFGSFNGIKNLLWLSIFPSSFDEYAASDILCKDIDEARSILEECIQNNEIEISIDTGRYFFNDLFRSYLVYKIENFSKNEWRKCMTRFIKHYLKTLDMCIVFCQQRIHTKGLELFVLEKCNFEASLKYALELEDWDLCAILYSSITKMIGFFVEGEQKKWKAILRPYKDNIEIMRRASVYSSSKNIK